MKILIKFIFFIFIFPSISNADLVKPNTNLQPFDVLMIQLSSLKNNNIPYKDAGIEQTWEFAHPNNKAITGPLDKFKKMIYSESYKILISHQSAEITILNLFLVYVLSIITNGFPNLSETKNTSMLSGSSANLLNLFVDKGPKILNELTPWKLLQQCLENQRYNDFDGKFNFLYK